MKTDVKKMSVRESLPIYYDKLNYSKRKKKRKEKHCNYESSPPLLKCDS